MKGIILLLVSVLLISAQAEEASYWLNGGNELHFKAGHTEADCGGIGESTIAFDMIMEMHIPCQSFGSKCDYKIKAELADHTVSLDEAVKSSEKYIVNLHFINSFSDDEFYMPKRSIYSDADECYINFPARILQKKQASGETFYPCEKVTFSDKPLYENK